MPLPARGDTPAGGAFPTIAEPDWVGQRFLILPQSRALQHYGYQELYRDSDATYAPLRYDDYAGRVVRVIGLGQGHGPSGTTLDEADLQVEGSKEIIHGDIDDGCMNDVALLSDLETARTFYRGRTLWLNADHLTAYDFAKDKSDTPDPAARQAAFKPVKFRRFSPVRVLDVVPGWYSSAPVRFVVQPITDRAALGYVDVHMSDTNVPKRLQAVSRFGNTFFLSDPHKDFAWPPSVWAAVENRQVAAGMTAAQVRLSWGEPKEISQITALGGAEQWAYAPNFLLTLKDGVLKKIETL